MMPPQDVGDKPEHPSWLGGGVWVLPPQVTLGYGSGPQMLHSQACCLMHTTTSQSSANHRRDWSSGTREAETLS